MVCIFNVARWAEVAFLFLLLLSFNKMDLDFKAMQPVSNPCLTLLAGRKSQILF